MDSRRICDLMVACLPILPAFSCAKMLYENRNTDEIHVEIPGFLGDGRRPEKFKALRERWVEFASKSSGQDERRLAARLHVGCALMLFYWNELSESDCRLNRVEALEAIAVYREQPKELTGERMIFEMSHLIDIKWKRKMVRNYRMSELEVALWEKRDRYFAFYKAPSE